MSNADMSNGRDMWVDKISVEDPKHQYIINVTSSVLRFTVKSDNILSLPICELLNNILQFEYKIVMAPNKIELHNSDDMCKKTDIIIDYHSFVTFWVSWFNGFIRIGRDYDDVPILEYEVDDPRHTLRGAKFSSTLPYGVKWILHISPLNLEKPVYKKLEGGQLRWETLTDGKLPHDAIVGGFEDEPLYVARARHNGSLCPGKYIMSKEKAYVPWGSREHCKDEFEILCGHDYQWIKCEDKLIPDNAFVAGYSEVNHGPLYAARAFYEGYLLPGKIHTLYNTCYLPYHGKEIETDYHEILVMPSKNNRAIMPSDSDNEF